MGDPVGGVGVAHGEPLARDCGGGGGQGKGGELVTAGRSASGAGDVMQDPGVPADLAGAELEHLPDAQAVGGQVGGRGGPAPVRGGVVTQASEEPADPFRVGELCWGGGAGAG